MKKLINRATVGIDFRDLYQQRRARRQIEEAIAETQAEERGVSKLCMDLLKAMHDAPTMAAGYEMLADFTEHAGLGTPAALKGDAEGLTETAKRIAWDAHGTAAGIKDVFEQYDGADGLWLALSAAERERYIVAARAAKAEA